jgi:hypothetical protein
MSTAALGPMKPPAQWVLETLLPGIKQMGYEADHSPASSIEAKNAWSYTFISSYIFMV